MKQRNSGSLKILIALLVITEASPCHAFFFRRLFGRRPFVSRTVFRPAIRNQGGFNQGFVPQRQFVGNFDAVRGVNNQINGNNVQEIAGFSNLLKNGNELIERNSRGEVRRLFIDGAGNLLGASEVETVRQAREFFLLNRDKFNAGQRQTVDRFLLRNGGVSDGKFTIDLKNIVMDEDVLKLGPQKAMEAALASLNFLLNTIQTNVRLRIPPERIKADGTVDLDLSPFFRGEALALLKAADPTFACTGKFRLDRLITFAMNPDNYYKFINAPKTRAEVAAAIGVEEDKTRTSGNKLLVGTNRDGEFESGVTKNLRVIEVQSSQRVPGSSCYRSLDVIDRNAPGGQSASRDVRQKGINFTHDAEEWLCLGRNGMMQGFLFNAAGNLLGRAPAEIATGALGTVGPAITAVTACLDCHAGGFIGGGKMKDKGDKFYTDRLNDIPPTDTVFRNAFGNRVTHRDFFTNNATYVQRAARDSNIFLEAQRATGSLFSLDGQNPFPVLPKMVKKFDKPLKAADIARTLGVSEAAAKSVIPPGENAIDRNQFESRFCNLRQGSVLDIDERQDRELFREESSRNNPFGGTTHLR
ncbi:MAG: hypothetical protein ACKOA8_13025 [Deltaproteobacteria bacterium]